MTRTTTLGLTLFALTVIALDTPSASACHRCSHRGFFASGPNWAPSCWPAPPAACYSGNVACYSASSACYSAAPAPVPAAAGATTGSATYEILTDPSGDLRLRQLGTQKSWPLPHDFRLTGVGSPGEAGLANSVVGRVDSRRKPVATEPSPSPDLAKKSGPTTRNEPAGTTAARNPTSSEPDRRASPKKMASATPPSPSVKGTDETAAKVATPKKQWLKLTKEGGYAYGYQREDKCWVLDPGSRRPDLPAEALVASNP